MIASLLSSWASRMSGNQIRITDPLPRCGCIARPRVEDAERDLRFRDHYRTWQTRSAAATAAAATRHAKTQDHVESIEISIPVMLLDQLAERACNYYNYHHNDVIFDGRKEPAAFLPRGEADEFRDRVCVNYLRHVATQYDNVLNELRSATGKDDARLLLFERIGKQITTAYPVLAEEAERQLREREQNDLCTSLPNEARPRW